MVRAFAVLIVVDAVRLDRREWQIDVLAVNQRSAVRILRLNVLKKLIDADVRREVLRVRSEDVEQLLVNRMLLTRPAVLRILILARVGVEEAWPGLRWIQRSRVVAKVHVVLIIIMRRRRHEDVIAEIVFLIVFVELLVRLLLRNLRRFAIDGRVERHLHFMLIQILLGVDDVARVILVIQRHLRRLLLVLVRLFVDCLVGF